MAERMFACATCGAQCVHHGARGRLPRVCAPCNAATRKPRASGRQKVKRCPSAGMVTFNCSHCGKLSERYYRGSGVVPTLCGVACKKAAHAKRHGRYTGRQRAGIADTLRVRVQVHMVGTSPIQGPPEPRRCGCGEYIRRKWYDFCSVCSDARAKANKGAARKAGKLRRRGARVEPVNLRAVLERDGWRCRLCGRKTPERLRGTFDPRAPEVDHIIPIAAGGEHAYRNTQCACRACNIAKGAAPLGQMRLF